MPNAHQASWDRWLGPSRFGRVESYAAQSRQRPSLPGRVWAGRVHEQRDAFVPTPPSPHCAGEILRSHTGRPVLHYASIDVTKAVTSNGQLPPARDTATGPGRKQPRERQGTRPVLRPRVPRVDWTHTSTSSGGTRIRKIAGNTPPVACGHPAVSSAIESHGAATSAVSPECRGTCACAPNGSAAPTAMAKTAPGILNCIVIARTFDA
jgi:hypothetical protein